MTVSTSANRADYTGNGATTTFPVPFYFPDPTNLQVLSTVIATGVSTTLVLNSDYTVAGAGVSTGGTVTTTVAPASTVRLSVLLNVAAVQTTHYVPNDPFPAASHEAALDYLTLLDKQTAEQVSRSIQVPPGETGAAVVLPPAPSRAGFLLGFDGNGVLSLIAAAAQSASALALSLLGSAGASMVGFVGRAVGMVTRTVQDKGRETVSVLDFGALGNCNGTSGNGHDDTAAIIAADAWLAANGGGELVFPHTGLGGYRVTGTVRPSSFVTWRFPEVAGFPYNNGALYGGLWADFSNVNQGWVVEANTKVSGALVAYNTALTVFPATPTYNPGLVNISIQCCTGATMPFGGIRMHGTAGAVIRAGSITGVGCAVLMNESQDYDVRFNSVTPYYGLVEWNECNAGVANFYANQGTTLPTTIPAGYLLSFMSALSTSLTASPYFLSTNAFYNMPCGYIRGGTQVSVSNEAGVTSQLWPIGVMTLNTRGLNIKRNYLESNANQMQYGLVAALTTGNIEGLHAFMSGTGALFDFGAALSGLKITGNGVNTFGSFGHVYADGTPDGSLVQISGFTAAQMLYTGNFRSVQFLADPSPFTFPALSGAWANVGGAFQTAGYRKNQGSGDIELCGFVQSGVTGTPVFTLPVGYRPANQRAFLAYGSGSGTFPNVVVSSAGVVTPTYAGTAGTNICLDGITFRAEQ